jgi:hypothetical protein
VRCDRELRVQREPQQAAVPEIVDLRSQIREHGRSGIPETVENFDDPAFLGDENPAVGRERGLGRCGQPADHGGVGEPGGHGRGCDQPAGQSDQCGGE